MFAIHQAVPSLGHSDHFDELFPKEQKQGSKKSQRGSVGGLCGKKTHSVYKCAGHQCCMAAW